MTGQKDRPLTLADGRKSDYEPFPEMAARFANDTAEHQMVVLRDDEGYRHLRVKKPGTGMYWFEIVTWPGVLTIRGDMGTFVFARMDDMFEFFRGQYVNPQYWAEKEISRTGTKRFDPQYAEKYLNDQVAERRDDYEPEDFDLIQKAVRAVIEDFDFAHHEGAHDLIRGLRVDLSDGTFQFYDTWEWDLRDWDVQFLWCCHAIAATVRLYDESPLVVASS